MLLICNSNRTNLSCINYFQKIRIILSDSPTQKTHATPSSLSQSSSLSSHSTNLSPIITHLKDGIELVKSLIHEIPVGSNSDALSILISMAEVRFLVGEGMVTTAADFETDFDTRWRRLCSWN
ncbi:hypothetical protein Droror1_Dr00012651 [Drosera rotundifolia]